MSTLCTYGVLMKSTKHTKFAQLGGRIDLTVHRQAKAASSLHGITLQDYIELALKKVISKEEGLYVTR